MNLGHPDCPYLLHPVCIVWWKPGCLCMAVCLCPSHLICVPTSCLECVQSSVHEFMCTWLPMSAPVPMHSLMETLVYLYGCLFVPQSPHFWSHTLFRMCTFISAWIYVHLTVHVYSFPLCLVSWKLGCPYLSLCLCPIHPACVPTILFRMCTCISTCIYVHLTAHDYGPALCIVWWKFGCPYLSLCMCVPVTLLVVPLPCLECVHASVHEFMSTWLPIAGPPLMHRLMETVYPCMAVCLFPSNLICIPTPCLECVHASVYVIMCTWLPRSGPDPMHSLMETWMPLYSCVFVSQSPHLFPHLVSNVYMHQYMNLCPPDCPHLVQPYA